MAEARSFAGAPSFHGVAPLQTRRPGLQPVVLLGLLGECAATFATMREVIGLPTMLAVHLGLVAAVTALQWRRVHTGEDGGLALLGVIAMLATGPFGAACALIMPLLTRRDPAGEALLPGWYDRIALSSEQNEFTRLSDRIAIGRAANLAAPLPVPFVELFKSGPLPEQQAALGLIARDFHPGYLPVLKMALASPEPVIRVQAAAVAARIRAPLNAHVAELFTRAADPLLAVGDAVDLAADMKSAIDSGLLEAKEQSTAASVRDGLLGRTFARLDARRSSAGPSQRITTELRSDDADDAYAAHLLAAGRLDEFRAFRRTIRRPLNGRYRRRLVQSRPLARRLEGGLAPIKVTTR